jgi:hypothetical protein
VNPSSFIVARSWGAAALIVIGGAVFACREEAQPPPQSTAPAPDEAPPPESEPEPTAADGEDEAAKTWPRRAAARNEVERTAKALEVLVREGATDPKDPWALAHGIVAFGPELKASDARLAVDAIVADYVLTREEEDRTIWYFPDRTPTGKPLEPHDNLIVKVLTTSGLPLDHTFPVRGGREVTLETLLESTLATFEKPPTAHEFGRQAWTVETIFASQQPGTRLTLDEWSPTYTELALYTMEAVTRLQEFLEAPMRQNLPGAVEKKKQGIYAHTCGGLHLIQAALRGASRVGSETLLDRAREQLDIARFRFAAERRIYRETIQQAPKYRTLLLVQEMKFYGHILETFGLATEWGVLTPTHESRRFIHEVAGDLVDAVRDLESVYAEIETYRSKGSQTYYDLIGDGCHAIRGLRLALKNFYEAEK